VTAFVHPHLVSAAPRSRPRLIVWTAIVGVSLAVATTGLGDDNGTVLCPFRRCTGVTCPGCGLTRATGALARGNLASAHSHHPLVLPILIQLAVGLLLWTFQPASFWNAQKRPILVILSINVLAIFGTWGARHLI